MNVRPDEIARQMETWIESNFPDHSPAVIAQALDMVRRRTTSRSVGNAAPTPTIAAGDIITTDGEMLGPVTRRQMFDAVHTWEQDSLRDAAPAPSLWHHTADYAIHVRYEPPDGIHNPHYVHVTAYHQDTRPGQERSEDALVRAIVHWTGPEDPQSQA